MHRLRSAAVPLALCAPLLLVAGCRVSTDKSNGNDNVKIATPFGNMQVKTNDAVEQASVGLPSYPGAELIKKGEGKDNGSADVNMSFGSFHLRVKALSYRTPDSPDKVKAFYQNALRHSFGDVIVCAHDRPVGEPVRTTEGLTCDQHGKTAGISTETDPNAEIELKTGSDQHQHIVSIEHEGAGTKFGLVALDLPGHLDDHDSNQSEQ